MARGRGERVLVSPALCGPPPAGEVPAGGARERRGGGAPERESLIAEAEEGLANPRLPRIAGAERSASGRAHCRHCKELIPAGTWRIRLSTFADSGFFDPLGFIHAGCAEGYFGVAAVAERVRRAAPDLDATALESFVPALSPPPA
jgi:hypothetical protein